MPRENRLEFRLHLGTGVNKPTPHEGGTPNRSSVKWRPLLASDRKIRCSGVTRSYNAFVLLRWTKLCAFLLVICALASSAHAAAPQIKKVLPQFFDAHGRNSLSPSLYERDAYQAYLRSNPNERDGLRFVVQWRGSSTGRQLRLRVEMRGVFEDAIQTKMLEIPVKKTSWFSTWTTLSLSGEEYRQFGELAAWRVTLWDGERQISEQKSFLW